jgi:hypothetical protein
MRRAHWILGLAGAAAATVLAVGVAPAPAAPAEQNVTGEFHRGPAPDSEAFRIRQGYQIAPVPLTLRGLDRNLVGLGSYIVNAQGGCNDCHTNPSYAPGHDPFVGQPAQVNAAHYLAGGQQFGPFISRNLTPEPPSGLPAGLTREQFRQVLRTGIDLDHEHPQFGPLLQVMPWPTYRQMTDRDIDAIYEYLRAIPHAEPGSSAS